MRAVGRLVRSFGLFWWDFVVGEDWRIAVGVVVALAATALLVHLGVPAWWMLPVAVLALLAGSLARSVRASRPRA
jgi:hypothetical protein